VSRAIIGVMTDYLAHHNANWCCRLLASDTRWIAIEGGNHTQLGWYDDQNGNRAATISRAAQQAQTVATTLNSPRHLERQLP
jgi:hypothetical protein